MPTLRALHRTSAVLIAAFALLHLANHLVLLAGVPAHIAFMKAARIVYRQPWVEVPLLLCVAFQVGSGLWLVVRGWKHGRGAVARLQALSGAILAFFLLIHVGAVLSGRVLLDLDTNLYFAVAGFYVPPFQFFFWPYYFLAVLALFAHLGCAAWRHLSKAPPRSRRLALALPLLVGSVVSLLIVLSLAGKIQPVEVPAEYKAKFTLQQS